MVDNGSFSCAGVAPASEFPVARQLRHRAQRETLSLQRCDPAVLPEWPAVDDAVVASAMAKRQLLSFDFDPTTLPSDVLCHLAMAMFVSAGLPKGVGEDSVRRFILAVRASMPDSSYHNFFHAIDVLQTTNALATATGTMARLDSWERFALLSAALCHDMNHAGVSEEFLSKAGDSTHGGYKNLVFRDALMEKHCALRAFGVMADRDIRILDGVTSAQYYQFRSSVSKIILATDMNRHSSYLPLLQEFAARRAEDPAVEMDKQLAMELMVKCADASNAIKPAEVARRWTLRVTDEFFDQGDAERCMGMEVSPNCDRFVTSRVALATAFIDYLAGPLFTLLAAAFPATLEAPLLQLAANRASYALSSDLDLEQSRGVRDSDSACSETQTEERGRAGHSSVEGGGGFSEEGEGGSSSEGGRGSSVGSREERSNSPSSETREGGVGSEMVVSNASTSSLLTAVATREPPIDSTGRPTSVFRKSPSPPKDSQPWGGASS